MRGIILLRVHARATAPVRASPPSKRSPRDPQRRGDMWAPLGRQTPRRRHLAAVKLVKLREQRAAVQPRRFERARSRASAARPVCAPLQCAPPYLMTT